MLYIAEASEFDAFGDVHRRIRVVWRVAQQPVLVAADVHPMAREVQDQLVDARAIGDRFDRIEDLIGRHFSRSIGDQFCMGPVRYTLLHRPGMHSFRTTGGIVEPLKSAGLIDPDEDARANHVFPAKSSPLGETRSLS